jgi:ABC-type Fe3+ transport system permease subunit
MEKFFEKYSETIMAIFGIIIFIIYLFPVGFLIFHSFSYLMGFNPEVWPDDKIAGAVMWTFLGGIIFRMMTI